MLPMQILLLLGTFYYSGVMTILHFYEGMSSWGAIVSRIPFNALLIINWWILINEAFLGIKQSTLLVSWAVILLYIKLFQWMRLFKSTAVWVMMI